MIFDTDIFIWIQRGNSNAARLIDSAAEKYLSVQTYMELLQGAQNKEQQRYTKDFIADLNFIILPLTENVGHRAVIYVEDYSLSSGLRAGDAIIAATAMENNMRLVSSNVKHFRPIKNLNFKAFNPSE